MSRKLPVADALSGHNIETRTRHIIKLVQPSALTQPMAFNVEKLFDCHLEDLTGVEADYQYLSPEIQGYTDIPNMVSIISRTLVEDSDNDAQRRYCRSTIGHECGHADLHVAQFRTRKHLLTFIHGKEDQGLKLYREESIPLFKNPEWQAWRYSKSLLMPAPAIQIALDRKFSIWDMIEAFDVNFAFAQSRLKEMKVLEKVLAL
jgi:hypothetical protein